jgi:hypothetical protein
MWSYWIYYLIYSFDGRVTLTGILKAILGDTIYPPGMNLEEQTVPTKLVSIAFAKRFHPTPRSAVDCH